MTTARKKWTTLDTVQIAEAVIANDGKWLTNEELEDLTQRVNCTRGSAEVVVWRMQTVWATKGNAQRKASRYWIARSLSFIWGTILD